MDEQPCTGKDGKDDRPVEQIAPCRAEAAASMIYFDQAEGVVADRKHRQALDQPLQLDLQLRAQVHALEQVLVLHLERNRDARPQQVGHPPNALRQVVEPARRRLAGAHGRLQAALDEGLHRRETFDAAFTQRQQPVLGQAAIGFGRAPGDSARH